VVEERHLLESQQKLGENERIPTKLDIDMNMKKLYDDENVTENIFIEAFQRII
jgi:hypothetical protein